MFLNSQEKGRKLDGPYTLIDHEWHPTSRNAVCEQISGRITRKEEGVPVDHHPIHMSRHRQHQRQDMPRALPDLKKETKTGIRKESPVKSCQAPHS